MYSDDDNFSGNSDLSSSSQDVRRSKRPRKKRLPHRGSREKGIDYSESKYFRQFDSAMNAKLWTDKLLDDEDDENDENNTNDNQDTNKNRSGSNKDRKSVV